MSPEDFIVPLQDNTEEHHTLIKIWKSFIASIEEGAQALKTFQTQIIELWGL